MNESIMTYPRGIAYHEAGHAVVGWSLGLRVGFVRVYLDETKGWKGQTSIASADHLSLIEQIALCAGGYTAELVFKSPAHKQALYDDIAKIYSLLKDRGISVEDHPTRKAEGDNCAHSQLEGHHSEVVKLAEWLIQYGHANEAEFLRLMHDAATQASNIAGTC
jgi:hypothetical protein